MDLCIPECALNLLQLETSRSSAVHFLLVIALVFSIQKLIASISVSLKNIIATRQLMCFCVFGISPVCRSVYSVGYGNKRPLARSQSIDWSTGPR